MASSSVPQQNNGMNVAQYNRCVELYSDGIFRFALKMLRSDALAQDCVQDCFERLWLHHSEVDFDCAKSYLFTSAHHGAIDAIRREKHRIDYLQQLPLAPTVHTQSPDLSDLLNRLAEQLPDVQRSVLMLRDYEGYAYEEIAQITGLTMSQVKVYIYRARLFMKERLVSIDAVV